MSVQYKDYYSTLGVPRSASAAEVKKAFRKLAREHHPDVAKDKKRAEEKFKEANEAYEVLGDAAKRKRYDELGANWKAGTGSNASSAWGNMGGARGRSSGGTGSADYEFNFGGAGFSDFFEQVFGGRKTAGGTGPQDFGNVSLDKRGEDIEGEIVVTLEEAMRGSVRSVNVRHAVKCSTCNGAGRRGQRTCSACGGEGRTSKSETYQVKVPAGVMDGQRLRLAGRGEAGARGGAAGDLFLRVKLAKHPDFEVAEQNLIYEAALTPWEAVLGANISVPTLGARVNIKIPAGTQNGQKLRVRGSGLPTRGGERGDLIVVTRVEVPAKVTDAEQELWGKLARASTFNPRET